MYSFFYFQACIVRRCTMVRSWNSGAARTCRWSHPLPHIVRITTQLAVSTAYYFISTMIALVSKEIKLYCVSRINTRQALRYIWMNACMNEYGTNRKCVNKQNVHLIFKKRGIFLWVIIYEHWLLRQTINDYHRLPQIWKKTMETVYWMFVNFTHI